MGIVYNSSIDSENLKNLDALWAEVTGSDGTPGATGEQIENYIKDTRTGAISTIAQVGSKYIFTMKDGKTQELNLVQGTTSYKYNLQLIDFTLEASEIAANNAAKIVTEKNSIVSAKLFYTLTAKSVFIVEGVAQDPKDWNGNVKVQVALCKNADGSDFNTCRDKKEFVIPTSSEKNFLEIASLFQNISDTRDSRYVVLVISNDENEEKYVASYGNSPYQVEIQSYSLDFPKVDILKTNKITITNVSGAKLQYYIRNISEKSDEGEYAQILDVQKDGTCVLTLPVENVTEASVFAISVRTTSASGIFSSKWENYNVIYQPASASTGLVAVNNIAQEVQDCNNNLLFNVVTTDKLTANLKIYVFKADNPDLLEFLSVDKTNPDYFKNNLNLLYKEIALELTNDTDSTSLPQSLYIEGITDKVFYLAFIIEDSTGKAYKFVSFSPTNSPDANYEYVNSTYTVKVNSVPEFNETQRLYHYSRNKKVDFSQIQTDTLFTKDILNDLDSADGMKYEDTVYFKASPASENVFKRSYIKDRKTIVEGTSEFNEEAYNEADQKVKGFPLKSANNEDLFASNTDFSVEFMFSTSNISDVNTEIFSIGNLKVYPDHLRIETGKPEEMPTENEKNVNKLYYISQADYQHSTLTHILITYCKEYAPSTYDYESIYGRYDLTPADKFDCIKIYVNGVINRVIPRNSIVFGDSYLQINSSKASTNFYIFRVYNECLNYEQVQKNRISSLLTLKEKKEYFLANDIVFNEEDYNRQVYTLSAEENALMGTISLAKCLGKMPFPENYQGIERNWNRKNVLLFVLDDRENVAELEAEKDYKGWVTPKEGKILSDYIKPLTAPLNYNNKSNKYPRASILVNYVNDDATGYDPAYSGLLFADKYVKDGELVEFHKAQGSSAKKYAGAYNDQFAKFKYLSEEERLKEKSGSYFYEKVLKGEIEQPTESDYVDGNPTTEKTTIVNVWDEESQSLKEISVNNNKYKANKPKYYKIKGENYEVAKLVGKVNIASSQQAHKLSACDFYNKAYKELIHKDSEEIYYRKAVNEKPFMYFYIRLTDITSQEGKENVTINNVSWDDIPYNKAKFFGMMTWGSAKGDKPSFGITDSTVYFEGADNKNACANFKVPWAAQQMWDPEAVAATFDYDDDYGNYQVPNNYKQQSGKVGNTPDYLTGLYIYDETIKFKFRIDGENDVNFAPDSWDVTGGTEESTNKTYKITNPDAFNRFAEFYNAVYLYDPASLRLLSSESTDLNSLQLNKKYVASRAMTVRGTYNGKTSKNNTEVQKDIPYSIVLNAGEVIRWDPLFEKWVPGGLYYSTNAQEWESLNVVDVFNEIYDKLKGIGTITTYDKIFDEAQFEKKVATYTNFSTKLSTARLGSGNSFEVLKKGFAEMFKCIINYYMNSADVSFHQACMKFLLGTDNRAKNTYWMLRTPESKIELFQDDLDTICKTDNNGQQTKSYNLLEPPFNELTKERWGDDASGFFTSYDLIYQDEINSRLATILDTYGKTIIQDFLAPQRYYPAVCYNHTSEIYYEVPQTIYQDGTPTAFCKKLESVEAAWEDFSNNQVPNPTSLSHGGCLEAETQFFKDRLLFLGSLVGSSVANDPENKIGVKSKSGTGEGSNETIELDFRASYNLYYYPKLLGTPITDKTKEQAAFIEKYVKPVDDFNILCKNQDILSKLAIAETSNLSEEQDLNVYHLYGSMAGSAALTAAGGIYNTHLIKSIEINKGFQFLDDLLFINAEKIVINSNDPTICSFGADSSKILDLSKKIGSVQELELHGTTLIGKNVTLLNCNALRSLKLYNCEVSSITLPKSYKLDTLTLSNSTKTVNVGYYPNLTIDHLDITQCQFTKVTIDARNSEEVIEEFINRTNFGSIEFQNIPESGLNLSVNSIIKLLPVLKSENCKFLGTQKINIIGNLTWEVKKQMLNLYGDSSWKNLFTYSKIPTVNVSISTEILPIQNSEIPEYGIQCLGKNDVASNDLFLGDFVYSLDKNDEGKGITVIPETGEIIFDEDVDGINFTVKIEVKYNGTTANLTRSFIKGFIPPQQYDFVYKDGTYSSQYLTTKKLLGWIYYVEQDGNNYYTRIITAQPITGRFGIPYRSDRKFEENSSEYNLLKGIPYISNNYAMVSTLGYWNGVTVNYEFEYTSQAISYDSSEIKILPRENFLRNRELFETQLVNNYKSIIGSYDNSITPQDVINVIYDGNTQKYNFDRTVEVDGQPLVIDAMLALYPVGLTAYRYAESEALSGKLKDSKWYPADIQDLEYIIKNKLNSCITLRSSNGWASAYSGKVYNYQEGSPYDVMYKKLSNAGKLIPLVQSEQITQLSSINFNTGKLLQYRTWTYGQVTEYRWQTDYIYTDTEPKEFYLTSLVCYTND